MPRRSSSQTHSGIAADPMSTIGRRQIVATKLYGYDWSPTQGSPHRRSYEAVADALAEAGTKLVLVQNQLDPMPASDVQQLPPEGEYDDLRFIRFPGFWEEWTPGTERAAIREYCFCPRCRQRFAIQRSSGNASPRSLFLPPTDHDLPLV